MKHLWAHKELIENFTLSSVERKLLADKTTVSKLDLVVLLKFFQYEGRFPRGRADVPKAIIKYIAGQIGVPHPTNRHPPVIINHCDIVFISQV